MKNVQCNNSIDVVKGGLISLVVIGHFLLGTLEGNFVRYYIYSFHMPMFIFISGFLIKREKIRSRSYKAFITHYAKRMLGWWAVAWCFYTGLSLIKDFDLNKIGHFLLDLHDMHCVYAPKNVCKKQSLVLAVPDHNQCVMQVCQLAIRVQFGTHDIFHAWGHLRQYIV